LVTDGVSIGYFRFITSLSFNFLIH